MPELPEVETVVRSLAIHVTGAKILRAEVRSKRVTRGDFAQTEAGLNGAYIQSVRRTGKQIFLDLTTGVLYIHLGMTGKLLWNAEPGKYTRALLELDRGLLTFDDIRQFGRFEYLLEVQGSLEKGPDALTVPFEVFYSRLSRHRGAIKAVLLNQSCIAGVGNVYADEILFAAKVHPRTTIRRISRKRAEVIHTHLLEILRLSVEHRGSSISDYADTAGNSGNFQTLHKVYGRAGQPCPRCGTPIRRIVVGQRGTHYCPRCQRV